MTQIIQLKKITKIEFIMDNSEVLLTYFIDEKGKNTMYHFKINSQILNKFLGEIQMLNDQKNIFDCLEVNTISENEYYYCLELEKNQIEINNLEMEYLDTFSSEIIEIRA